MFSFAAAALLGSQPQSRQHEMARRRYSSMTHDVDKFARNMAPTALQGQAAGTFAALAAGRDWNRLPVETVRARLACDGVPVSIS